MKRFVFSLKALYEYKQTLEKLQKGELSRAQEVLRALYAQRQALDEAFERGKQTLEEALRSHKAVAEALTEHDVFFRHLSGEREKLEPKILNAEAVRDRCQQQLIATMKELKAYAKLRDEQYQRYLKEVQVEEEKEMSDLVSFNTVNDEQAAAKEPSGSRY